SPGRSGASGSEATGRRARRRGRNDESSAGVGGMHRSEGRILVTHVGSFPRPPRLRELLIRQERGEPVDETELARETAAAVDAVAYADLGEGARECDLCERATTARSQKFIERFMTAASPGIIATTLLNAHYDSHERYVFALAREMQKEYELIHSRGLLLQLDCPDLAMERTRLLQHEPLERFLQIADAHGEAINRAPAT